MPIPHRPPAPTLDDWLKHARALKKVRATVCFAMLAQHYGSYSPIVLETRVDGRLAYISEVGERSWSGKYRRWLRDGILPSDETSERVLAHSGGAVDLRTWRDLRLWKLLTPAPPTLPKLHDLMEQFPAPIRNILFFASERNHLNRFIHTDVGRQRTLRLRNIGSLDAFAALLCLAREGELLSDDPRHSLPAMCAFDVFPRVLLAHAQLRYRWESLYACVERIYWRRLYGDGAYLPFAIDRVRANLAALDTNPLAPLDVMSGVQAARNASEFG